MANQDDFGVVQELQKRNLEYIKEHLNDTGVEELVKKLKSLKRRLQENKLIITTEANRYIRWSAILNHSYSLDFDRMKSLEMDQQIIQIFFNAYEITSKILQKLNIISPVKNVVNFIDNDYNYVRLEDVQFQASYFYLNKADTEKGNYYGLKFKQSAFKEQIEKAKKEKDYEVRNKHFQNFVQQFRDYEAVTTTGWKINKGVLAETFERHWQNFHSNHQLGQDLQDNPPQSYGKKWWMYRQSSGSDPYFTGPDTRFSQVKSTNASLVSNLNTVLNTIEGVLAITNKKKLEKISQESLDKVFKQSNFSANISKKIYDGMEQIEQAAIKQAISEVNFTGSSNFKVNKK